MKCGICGKDKLTNGAPIWDAGILAFHKRQEHPVEARATAQRRYDTRIDNRRRKAAIDAAVRVAAAQATGVVLRKSLGSDVPHPIENIMGINSVGFPKYHVAEPALYARYQALTAQAAVMLEQAYQQGRPITEADVERVRQAIAEARQKAETEVA